MSSRKNEQSIKKEDEQSTSELFDTSIQNRLFSKPTLTQNIFNTWLYTQVYYLILFYSHTSHAKLQTPLELFIIFLTDIFVGGEQVVNMTVIVNNDLVLHCNISTTSKEPLEMMWMMRVERGYQTWSVVVPKDKAEGMLIS